MLYDLVIYDRCRPKEMPEANTFFLGSLPSGDAWKAKPKSDRLHIIDTDSAHPDDAMDRPGKRGDRRRHAPGTASGRPDT